MSQLIKVGNTFINLNTVMAIEYTPASDEQEPLITVEFSTLSTGAAYKEFTGNEAVALREALEFLALDATGPQRHWHK